MEELSAGIKLHVINTEKFKTVIFCVLIRRPLSRSEATANALIPNILKRGSAKYDGLSKLNSAMEAMYGSIFEGQIVKKGEEQILQFYMETVNKGEELYADAIEFMKEIILRPLTEGGGFRTDYSNGEIENLRNIINSRINNKNEYARLKCLELMCGDEPFGVYGDGYLEDLDGVTPQSIYEHYRMLMETSPIDFVCIGNVDADRIKEIIANHFILNGTDGFSRTDIVCIPQADFSGLKRERQIHEEDHGSVQGKLSIGCRSGIAPTGEDFYRLMTANEILGGGANSRLFVKVRENESLCYNIHSFVYRFKTIIMIESGIDPDNFNRVIELVEKEIESVKKGEVTDEEFETGKKSLVKKFKGIQDYPSATMDFYTSQYMLGDEDRLEDVIEKILAVEKEAVIHAAGGIGIDTVMMLR